MQSLQLWFAFDTDAIKDNPIPETPLIVKNMNHVLN